jgi:hypothetical protein
MKEQILRQMIGESIKKIISETNALNEYSGDSGLEELVEVLGYSDVMDFFEDNSGAVEAVTIWAESIPAFRQKLRQSGMYESKVNEASMSDIDIMAQEAKDFKSFVTEFIKTHHDLSKAGEPGQFKEWLQSIYDNAKVSMDESVVNEADMSRQYDGYIVLDQKTKKQYKFRYIRGVDNVDDENDAIKTIMYLTKQPRTNFIVHGLIKKGEFDKTKGEVVESTNAMKSKIREAGGRRFAKTESIRQYNSSKIKEANKKK